MKREEIQKQIDEIRMLMDFSDPEETKFLRTQIQYCRSLLKKGEI